MSIEKLVRAAARAVSVGALAWAVTVSAQSNLPANTTLMNPGAPADTANAIFPRQNPAGPTGSAYSTNYPYEGQCVADAANSVLFPALPLCGATSSFACADALGNSSRTSGKWAACGATPFGFNVLQPIVPNSLAVAPAIATPKFIHPVLNPMDYTPDTTTFPGADYYEIGVHEARGFQGIASAGTALNIPLFPNPTTAIPAGPAVPEGMQWTGLICTNPAGCTCPADASATFKLAYCNGTGTAVGKIPAGAPLYTPIWGVGQINNAGGPVTQALVANALFAAPAVGTTPPWSSDSYVATWPSISIRANRGRPVVVKWVNEFPNNHVLCPHPDAADWPCSIDRTFMGVKHQVDPLVATEMSPQVPWNGVNKYGSPQQPDNSWVTHLHGGEIPPGTDGFTEKWFGNSVTAPLYTPATGKFINPSFENPSGIALKRPGTNFDTYSYPMVQEEATIWFHDHTLGKTHHNVIAGPAGFFPVKEPLKHGAVTAGVCTGVGSTCEYTWLDPVTEPRGALNIPKYDLFFAIQDRSFNDDGSINFSNGLGQPQLPIIGTPACAALGVGAICAPPGSSPITNGVNPLVHPTWIPEYFGDHVLVNGVLWPRMATEPGWYRMRIVDGSDSRCWTLGFSTSLPAPGTKPLNNVNFYVIANDQGYMQKPVLAPARQLTMCPGERYELLVNFGKVDGLPAGVATTVYMTNSAPAPFPAGITPFAAASPYAEMNVVMRFDVNPLNGPGVKSCATATSFTWDPLFTQAQMTAGIAAGTACMPANPALNPPDPAYVDLRASAVPLAQPLTPVWPAGAIVRQLYLNERLDGVTLAPMGMQLNGVPFEYKVTETPKYGSREIWQFVNLTVDAHPMHPHLIKHQVVARQRFNVGGYKALLCGSTTCQPGTAPGGEMQVVPDVTPLLLGAPVLVTPLSVDGGYKDATQVPPGMVTTIIADWSARWNGASPVTPLAATAPGTAGCPFNLATNTHACAGSAAGTWAYESAGSGPFVWHCHINSHEDSEMMRTSLVVK